LRGADILDEVLIQLSAFELEVEGLYSVGERRVRKVKALAGAKKKRRAGKKPALRHPEVR
jgi:hypothetical protein